MTQQKESSEISNYEHNSENQPVPKSMVQIQPGHEVMDLPHLESNHPDSIKHFHPVLCDLTLVL